MFSVDFNEKLILLVAGFAFTTLCGSLIGTWLQRSSWKHQWNAQNEKERSAASRALFEDLSRLFDRRLFRTIQLYSWSRRGDPDRMQEAMAAYRVVFAEWNESISRNLSMLQFYFGTDLRAQLDFEVGQTFVDLGAIVQRFHNEPDFRTPQTVRKIDRLIAKLRREIYAFNLSLLGRMDKKAVEGQDQLFKISNLRLRRL